MGVDSLVGGEIDDLPEAPGGEGGGGAVSHVPNRKHDIIWPREAAALIKKTYTLHF